MPAVNLESPWVLAQASLKYFTVKFLKLKWFNYYADWEKMVMNDPRDDVQAHRGSGKSIFWSLAVPLWDVIRGPEEGSDPEDILISYSEDQVRRLIRQIRIEVETNEFLAPLRPTTREIWGTDQLSFPNGYLISGLGFGTSSRGKHPRRLIIDDPLKDLGGMSQEDQERAYFGVITGMAMPKTQIHTIGTPVSYGDLFTKLETNPVYKHWRGAALDAKGTILCPQLFTKEILDQRRLEMGSINFAREYLLQRIDPATQPFKQDFETLYVETPPRFARIVTVCDPAYSETDGDATGIVTVGFTHGNHAYVLDAKEVRREDPGRIVDELFKTIAIWRPDVVGIERRKGEAVSFSFNERRTRESRWDFKYVELSHGGMSKGDRAKKVGGVIPRWEARAVHVHKSQTRLLTELYQFRFDDQTKGNDDLVDALAYCFHPDMVQPNAGKSNVPMDIESASMEGKPRYQVGQGETWFPRETHQWVSGHRNYERSWGNAIDQRIGDAA